MTAIVKQKSWLIVLLGAVLALQSLTAMSRVPDSVAIPAQAEQPNILFIFTDDWGWATLAVTGIRMSRRRTSTAWQPKAPTFSASRSPVVCARRAVPPW